MEACECRIHLRDFRTQALGQLQALVSVRRAQLTLPMLHTFKDGAHAVVVSLQDGIKLVIMAACAADCESKEGAAGGADEVMHFIGALIRSQHRICAFHLIPCTGYEKARALIHAKLVAGDLFAHKLVIRFVLIERTNDVVAIRPRIGAHAVHFEAVAFGKAHHIEPMPRPAFTVAR